MPHCLFKLLVVDGLVIRLDGKGPDGASRDPAKRLVPEELDTEQSLNK
jgi:hypothetical protein